MVHSTHLGRCRAKNWTRFSPPLFPSPRPAVTLALLAALAVVSTATIVSGTKEFNLLVLLEFPL